MKSIILKISIIILSLLASTHTFAFSHGDVCAALNAEVTADGSPTQYAGATLVGPIYDIVSRKTAGSDPRGQVCGSLKGGLIPQVYRICGQSGLECSGDTCHVNKKWDDCECTNSCIEPG